MQGDGKCFFSNRRSEGFYVTQFESASKKRKSEGTEKKKERKRDISAEKET